VLELSTDCLTHISEESVNTDAYQGNTSEIKNAVQALAAELGSGAIDRSILAEVQQKAAVRVSKRQRQDAETVCRRSTQVYITLIRLCPDRSCGQDRERTDHTCQLP
jgi:hypothetical protein